MGDFVIGGKSVNGTPDRDRGVGGADVFQNIIYTPDLGILTSGNLSTSTSGNVITLYSAGTTIIGGTTFSGGTNVVGGTFIDGTIVAGTQIIGGTTIIGGTQVSYTTQYLTSLLPGPSISLGTNGDVITISSIDPSGTIFSEISNWGGTYEGGGSPLGLLEGSGVTFSTSGDVITINGIDPSGTILSTLDSWHGTLAKSGTTPSISQVNSWLGTVGGGTPLGVLAGNNITLGSSGDVVTVAGVNPSGTILSTISSWQGTDLSKTLAISWLGTKIDSTVANSWMGTTANYSTMSSWGGTYAKSGTTPSYTEISTWQGTLAKSGTTPDYATISTWMGTAGGQTDYATIASWGGTYAKSGTTPSIAQVSSWIGTTGSGSSNRVLLATGTANNSASIIFTQFDNSIYRSYFLRVRNAITQTTDESLVMYPSSNSGGTYWGSGQLPYTALYLATAYVNTYGNTAWFLTAPINTGEINSSREGFSADVSLNTTKTSSNQARCTYRSIGNHSFSDTYNVLNILSGHLVPAAEINTIKLQMTAGNISSGLFELYGDK